MRILLILILLFSGSLLRAQDHPVVERDGKKYYQYQVEQGNTLYGISKSFLIPVDELLKINPELQEGLKAGQIIFILVSKENRNLRKADAPILLQDILLHTVKKGETLYAISRMYEVTVDEVTALNPAEVEAGIKPDMVIKIPLRKKTAAKEAAIQPVWLRHKVEKGETLYSLARYYNVNIDSIGIVNNGLPEGLREGMIISIPKRIKQERTEDLRRDSMYKVVSAALNGDSTIAVKQVVLLLPFFINKNRELERAVQPEIYQPSEAAMAFYQGFKLGLDSFWKDKPLEVKVLDSGNDSLTIIKLFQSGQLDSADLIIGPLYAQSFGVAASKAAARGIPIVSPFSQTPGLGSENKQVVKLSPSTSKILTSFIPCIGQFFPDRGVNYILVNTNSVKDKPLVEVVRKNWMATVPFKEINLITAGVKGIQQLLQPIGQNVLIVPSVEKAQVTDLLTKLYFLEEMDITVIGTDQWLSFENLDIEYLERLKVTIPSGGFIDFNDSLTHHVVQQYRETFGTEADVIALRAFDMAALLNYLAGNIFSTSRDDLPSLLYTTYDLAREREEGPRVNRGFTLLRFNGYRFQKIRGR